MLGLDQTTIGQLIQLGNELRHDLRCMVDELAALKRQHSYQLGRPRTDVDGYDPAALPGITGVAPAPGETLPLDFRALLGKPATHGFIQNIGKVDVELVFVKAAQGSDGTTQTQPLVLAAGGEKLPIDGAIDKISVNNDATAVDNAKVQAYVR